MRGALGGRRECPVECNVMLRLSESCFKSKKESKVVVGRGGAQEGS